MISLKKTEKIFGILFILFFITLFSTNHFDRDVLAASYSQAAKAHSTALGSHEHESVLMTKQLPTTPKQISSSKTTSTKEHLTASLDKRFIPGGQSIGVQLQTLGVLIVGHHLVFEDAETSISPGEEASLQVGDMIIEMNGETVNKVSDIKPIVNNAGEKNRAIKIKYKRSEKELNTSIKPVLNKQNNTYQIGLYIRDEATGIGTISFYDKKTNKYGALGHIISDSDTKKPIEIYKGKIVHSLVTSIQKGNKGDPGEKEAKFSMNDSELGTVTNNSHFGIFGKIDPDILHQKEVQKPLPITMSHEVKEGPAKILTVIKGEEVEEFDIEIVKSIQQDQPATKGMVIKVTDERLLEATGGIIQGMSGSPIIQNDKLIGAVTHVFVNDPTSGYGVHIEWMLDEAEINLNEEQQIAS